MLPDYNEQRRTNSLERWGWVMACLIPLIGFIIGVALVGRRPASGVGVMILSIFAFFVWVQFLYQPPHYDWGV